MNKGHNVGSCIDTRGHLFGLMQTCLNCGAPKPEPMNAKAHARCLDVLMKADPYAQTRLWDLLASNKAADVLKVHREISMIHTWVEDFMRAMAGLAEED